MKKSISWLCSQIATLGPVGYLPAPGTMGTLCALPVVVGLRKVQAYLGYFSGGLLALGCVLLAVWIINRALERIDGHDPSEIVLDEVVGFIVTMIFFPLNIYYLTLGFLYFRFFDIVKPLGIQHLERIGGAWGIVLDDVVAAFLAQLALVFTFDHIL
jgi:phosphatidylglycerophosphatase A